MESLFLEKMRMIGLIKDIEQAMEAMGGKEFNEKYCECDESVGSAPCRYCII